MVFKLIRIDTQEPCKIHLPFGTHLIGRGKFLDCGDKRVSRHHGELTVSSDTVIIKSLHQNPCFVIRKGTVTPVMIRKNAKAEVNNGDKFGLLPDSYWFELIHCALVDVQTRKVDTWQVDDSDSRLTEPNEEDYESYLKFDETVDNVVRPGSPLLKDAASNTEPGSENSPAEEGASPIKRSHGLDADPSDITKKVKTEPDEKPACDDTASNTEPKSGTTPAEEAAFPIKRSQSLDADPSDITKKVKKEPEEKPACNGQDSDNAEAGPSNPASAKVDNCNDNKPTRSPPKPVLRERCMYGASCYRRNVQHKATFSHPGDADYGAGERGVCPWGAGCRRPGARHWQTHDHPPGTSPPPPHPPHPPGKRRRKPKPSDNDDDSDTPAPDLIVQGKRTRKVILRPNNWSESEPEIEDPFQTDDESDEWEPSANMTDSQIYTQDTEGF